MKRYGILPETAGANEAFDVYSIEKQYWKSLWCKPKEK